MRFRNKFDHAIRLPHQVWKKQVDHAFMRLIRYHSALTAFVVAWIMGIKESGMKEARTGLYIKERIQRKLEPGQGGRSRIYPPPVKKFLYVNVAAMAIPAYP